MLIYRNIQPLVSVVMPTFNRRNFLGRSISSVINQSFSEWELVIVDDGSTDDTFNIVSTFMNEHENIRYIKHTNRKISLSLNAGIATAAGRYVTFLGSDDAYKPEHLISRIEIMNSDPAIDFLHGGVEIVGNPFVKDKHDLSREIHISDCVVGATFFAEKKLFVNENGFGDIPYSEDSEFFERIKGRYNIRKIELPTYIYYRDTPDSICNTIE